MITIDISVFWVCKICGIAHEISLSARLIKYDIQGVSFVDGGGICNVILSYPQLNYSWNMF